MKPQINDQLPKIAIWLLTFLVASPSVTQAGDLAAAFTYERPVTTVEIYGNYPDYSVDKAMLYRSAMELFVRGANLMIPHGMSYEPATMHIPPENRRDQCFWLGRWRRR